MATVKILLEKETDDDGIAVQTLLWSALVDCCERHRVAYSIDNEGLQNGLFHMTVLLTPRTRKALASAGLMGR